MRADAVELRLDEANELLSAWAQHVAENRGIRLLLLKGRALSDYGLRPQRVSADVDALIEPARFDEFCDAVLAAGWEEFPGTFASEAFTLHSRSFRKNGWPDSFDVHSYFPGFLRDPADVFDVLWQRQRSLTFAHRTCQVPDRASSVLVLALHSLRGTQKQDRHRAELDAVRGTAFSDAERADIGALAVQTGADAPLRHLLRELGIDLEVDDEVLHSPEYREWQRKTAEAQGAAASWLLLFAKAPWRDKPRVLWRALWPSRHDFLIDHPEVPDRPWPQARARFARLGRGFARLPHAIAALLRR